MSSQSQRPPLGDWKLPCELDNIIWEYYPVAWASELLAYKFVKYALMDEEDSLGKYLCTPTLTNEDGAVHWMWCSEDLSDDLNPGVYSMVYFIDGTNVDSEHELTRPIVYSKNETNAVFGKTMSRRINAEELYEEAMFSASSMVSRYIGRFI